jgi:RHS repeat-associated protein
LFASTYGLIDNLSYSYSGNRLTSVNDAVSGDHEVDFVKRGSGAYNYWENGALKSDENKEITNIIYNTFLNLPQEIQLTGERWIKMTYDGSGALIKREFSTGEYWEYAEGFIFKNGQFYSFGIPEGRAVYEGGVWKYEFFYQDHLQNTRVTFSAEGNRLVKKDATDFEPMGTRLNGTGVSGTPENRHKYQNKESLTLFGLGNINDFSARYLDKSTGRFWGSDPLADHPNQLGISPYAFANNNPIRFIDPDGKLPLDVIIIFNKSNGKLSVVDKDHYQSGLPTRRVSASDYVHGGIRDSEGKLTHNQVLLMDNFFSGGKATDGNISRDLISDPSQLPIPNGRYDLLEYEGRDGWYKVDAIDNSRYDDHHQGQTNAQGKTRSGYRLHQGTLSHGCITCDVSQGDRQKEWDVFEKILENTSKTSVPMREGSQKFNPFSTRLKYGEIKVTGTDEIKKD